MSRTSSKGQDIYKQHPAKTLEARENQMIALAEARAEEMLLDGTASPQIICHYLKLGSSRQRLETEKLRHETELLKSKKLALENAQHSEEIAKAAIEAFKEYSGRDD